MSAKIPSWGSDVPISMPQPPPNAVEVPMHGFGMSRFGLVHDLTEVEFEALRVPSFAPEQPYEPVYDDQDVEE